VSVRRARGPGSGFGGGVLPGPGRDVAKEAVQKNDGIFFLAHEPGAGMEQRQVSARDGLSTAAPTASTDSNIVSWPWSESLPCFYFASVNAGFRMTGTDFLALSATSLVRGSMDPGLLFRGQSRRLPVSAIDNAHASCAPRTAAMVPLRCQFSAEDSFFHLNKDVIWPPGLHRPPVAWH